MFRILALLLVVLTACGELPRPFQPDFKDEDNPILMLPDRAGIVVQPVAGLPDDAALTLAQDLSEKLQAEGLVATTGRGNATSLVLVGNAQAEDGGWLTHFDLRDAHGNALGTTVAHLDAPRDDGRFPPAAVLAVARSVARVLQPSGTAVAAIKPTVAIGDVTGAPGNGGRALARALEYTLQRNNIQIAPSPEQATHIVVGAINIAPPRGRPGEEERRVDVRWTVLRADRSEIGEVRQTNDVPARMVDRNWAEIVMAVADAAVDGIAGLVERPQR